jgi:polyisoprenoid-binding protein YceI
LFCVTLLLLVLSVATSAATQPKAYTVAAGRSQVTFEATYPLGNFTGTTEKVTGELRINPDNVTQGITGHVTINPGDLKTGLEGRDRDLKKALEADTYPEIRFKVQDVRASFPSLAERADITLQIGGMMLIRGVERVMPWTGRARIEDGMIWVRGETELRMTDFGITPPRKLFLAVGNSVRVSFDLRLAPKE